MTGQVDLSAIIRGAYDAALQDDLWEAWSLDLMKAFGSSGGFFCLAHAGEQRIMRTISLWGPEKAIRDYTEEQHRHDPQLRVMARLAESSVFVGLPGIDREEKCVRDYLRWQEDVARIAHHQTAVINLEDSPYRVGLSLHRNHALGPVDAESHRQFQQLLPDLRRAIALGFCHGDMLQESFWRGLTTGACRGQIAFLVDEHGKVIRQTDEALALIERRDGLDLSQQRFVVCRHEEQGGLDRIIAMATQRAAPRSGAMRIMRPSGRSALAMVAYPLQRSTRMLAPAEAAALVTVVDPNAKVARQADLYRQAFGLSDREAQFATLLLNGHSVESASVTQGIAMATARTHMRRLYEKTDTTGQVPLLQLLAKIG